MERTKQILDLFNFGKDKKYIFKGINWEVVYDISLNEFDCWRLFNYFQELYSNIESHISKHQEYMLNKNKIFYEFFKEKLEEIKMFVLKDEIKKRFLIDLKAPKKIKEELKIPFDNFFLDADFKINENTRIFGIWVIFYQKEGIKEFNKRAEKIIQKRITNIESNTLALRFLYATDKDRAKDCEPVFLFDDCLYDLENGEYIQRPKLLFEDGGDKLTDFKQHRLLEKFISNFITNLLLFFNEPRVVTYIFNRPQKNREKRGKIPIPSEIRTKIHMDLENYIEKFYFAGQSHSKLGFAYWVMGHYRILRSNYYIHKKGEKIWIPFHLRGEGLMPPQVFEITR